MHIFARLWSGARRAARAHFGLALRSAPFAALFATFFATLFASSLLAGCGGGGGSSSSSSSSGTTPVVSLSMSSSTAATGQTVTLSWSASNATSCTASGSWSGSKATSGSSSVTQTAAGAYSYSLSCSGTGGTGSASTTLTVSASVTNSVAMVVGSGPTGVGSVINVPYVDVTICNPGTGVCQTIDHVLVDTGSYGLRLLSSVVDTSTLGLPSVTAPSGSAAYECAQFVSGYEWGPVKQADVRLGGEVASGISIQLVNSASTTSPAVPTSCSNTGSSLGSVSALGANGILGVGLFNEDCGTVCANYVVSGTYYSCPSTTCTASKMPVATQVSNPVASFSTDNNGVVLSLPSVASGGLSSLTGSLIFGIGTQSNNSIGTASVYTASSSGYFTTTYNSTSMALSFIDSGSNGLFFHDTSITACTNSTGFFCPASTLTLSATNTGYTGSATGTVSFSIENVDNLSNSVTVANVGGSVSSLTGFDWGLPFFFGRKVFVGLEGAVVNGSTGPFWAY